MNPYIKRGVHKVNKALLKKIERKIAGKKEGKKLADQAIADSVRKKAHAANKKESKVLMISQHNDYSIHNVKCEHVPKKKKLKCSGKMKFRTITSTVANMTDDVGNESISGVILGKVGLQSVGHLPTIMSMKLLRGDTVSITGTMDTEACTMDIWQYDPFRNPTNSADFIPGNTHYNNKLVINSVTAQYEFVNCSNTATELNVVWLMCNKTTNVPPTKLWTQLASYEATDVNTSIAQGATVTFTGASGQNTKDNYVGTASAFFPGATPWDIKEFKQFWRPIGEQKFILQGGDTHRLQMHIPLHKIFTRKFIQEQYDNSGSNAKFVQGFSIVPMVIGRGQPIGLNPVDSTGAKIYVVDHTTYADVKVGLVSTYLYNIGFVPQSQGKYQLVEPHYLVNVESATTDANNQAYRTAMINDVDVASTRIEV